MTQRIVLGYSGSLASSVAIPWLTEQYGAEVVAVTLDLGQSRDLEEVRDRALACGAMRAHVLDVRDELARDWILPALHAGALHQGGVPVQASLAYPLVAARLVELAGIEQAEAVAHGSAGRSTPGVAGPAAIDACVHALDPGIRVIAPARDWCMTPAQQRAYAQAKGIPVAADERYSVYENVSGRAIRWVADVPAAPEEDAYRLTASVARASSIPANIEIAFEQGIPVAVNGVPMMLTELIASVATIAGHHAVGRLTSLEPRTVYEAPAGVVLNTALDALGADVRQSATGVVRMTLFKGEHTVIAQASAQAPLSASGPGTLNGPPVSPLVDSHP